MQLCYLKKWQLFHFRGKYSKHLNRNNNIIIIYHPCFLRNVFQINRPYGELICMQFIFEVSISMRHTNEFVTLCAGKYHVQSGRGETLQLRGHFWQLWQPKHMLPLSHRLSRLFPSSQTKRTQLASAETWNITHKKVGINVRWISFKKHPSPVFLTQTFSRNRLN